jgi:hypothetical protein
MGFPFSHTLGCNLDVQLPAGTVIVGSLVLLLLLFPDLA